MEDDNEGIGAEQEPKGEGLGDAGKRALDAERKARQAAEKRAREAEARIKQAEDAEKTEVERLQAQVADLTKDRDAAVSRADRFEIAAAKGLSLAQARRLVGTTKEELEQDADEMRAELGLDKESKGTKDDEKETAAPAGRPKEDLKMGASNEEDEMPDAGKLADSILKSAF